MNIALRKVSLAREELDWPPEGTTVIDVAGMPVDISGSIWRLNAASRSHILNWDLVDIPHVGIRNAIRQHFAHLIERQRPHSVRNAFGALAVPTSTAAFRDALAGNDPIPYLVFSEARAIFGRDSDYLLHYWRKLYMWCALRGIPRFARSVSFKLSEQTIGGNAKGRAVRSADPTEGPLTSIETFTLTAELRAARLEGVLKIQEEAALWLGLSCGANTSQYASLREEDLLPMKLNGERVGWIIQIPRHKKGDAYDRSQFKRRKLNNFIGAVLQELIDKNRRDHPIVEGDVARRPLFWSKSPRYDPEHPMAEWMWHSGVSGFNQHIRRAVLKLGAKSRTGEPLSITSRRLRYTLATRMVASGASRYAVAHALDHSDLQQVPVYFDVDENIVDNLDAALALALAPRAQAFVVAREEDAQRGDLKGSRCHFSDRETDTHEPIGTCGNDSFCNVVGPMACYTCRRFQPWMDGPHEEVLDFLVERRAGRQDQGLDAKLVGIEDNVILAVAGVIKQIAGIREERSQ